MDPDTALEEIRELVEEILAGAEDNAAFELAEKIECLDTWLTHKGFLPKDWQRRNSH